MSDYEVAGIAYDTKDQPYRGFHVRASYLKASHQGDATIEIFRDGVKVRGFLFPAYKIYNIAAHFTEIVDGEIANDASGYEAAASTGFHTPSIELEPLPPRSVDNG